jgi:hypothetical protein
MAPIAQNCHLFPIYSPLVLTLLGGQYGRPMKVVSSSGGRAKDELQTKGRRCRECTENGGPCIKTESQREYMLISCHSNGGHNHSIPKLPSTPRNSICWQSRAALSSSKRHWPTDTCWPDACPIADFISEHCSTRPTGTFVENMATLKYCGSDFYCVTVLWKVALKLPWSQITTSSIHSLRINTVSSVVCNALDVDKFSHLEANTTPKTELQLLAVVFSILPNYFPQALIYIPFAIL